MARSRSIASLAVTLTARTSTFRKRLFAAKALLKRFGSAVLGASGTFAKLGTAAALAGVAITTALVKRQFSAIDTLGKVAKSTNITTEALAGLRMAGRLSGISNELFDRSLQKMTKNIGEAATGIGEAVASLEDLGLNISILAQLDAATQFGLIAEGIRKIALQSTQARVAQDLFGRSGISMLAMFQDGMPGMRQAAADATQFGIAISNVAARQVENANDSFERLRSVINGVTRQLAVNVAPFAESFSDIFVDMAKQGRTMAAVVADSFESASLSVLTFLDQLESSMLGLRQFQLSASLLTRSLESPFFSGGGMFSGGGNEERHAAAEDALIAAQDAILGQRSAQSGRRGRLIKGFANIRFDAQVRAQQAINRERFDRLKNRARKTLEDAASGIGGFFMDHFPGGRTKPAVVKDPELIVEVRRVTAAIERGNGAAIIGR